MSRDKTDSERSAHAIGRATPRIDWNKLVHLFQMLTVAISACWILYKYITYQQHADGFSLRQQQLQIDQTQALSRLAALDFQLRTIESKYAERRIQLEMQSDSLQSALHNIQLRYASSLAGLTQKEKEQQTELQRIQLQYADALTSLTLRDKERETVEGAARWENAIASNFQYTDNWTVRKVGEAGNGLSRYAATINVSIKNTSLSDLEVTYTIIEGFLAQIPAAAQVQRSILDPGIPPNAYYRVMQPPFTRQAGNGLEWAPFSKQLFVLEPLVPLLMASDPLFQTYSKENSYTTGGAGTGSWKSGQEMRVTHTYYLTAEPGSFVGFVVTFCFDRCAGGQYWWFPFSGDLDGLSQATE